MQSETKPQVPYGTYIMIWLGLLVLTGVTITAAGLSFGQWSALAAIVIATVKASLVLFFFMHLKYESVLFKGFLVVALLTLAVIMFLTFADTSFRV
ncbi:MAG: cytochrome-c oxidase [Candidatus Eisenbacteria bacterium]|nr:cytochrome-c oxidase [Candidatus Eisenbacteria bacterium]